jgi:hypothetical protein
MVISLTITACIATETIIAPSQLAYTFYIETPNIPQTITFTTTNPSKNCGPWSYSFVSIPAIYAVTDTGTSVITVSCGETTSA